MVFAMAYGIALAAARRIELAALSSDQAARAVDDRRTYDVRDAAAAGTDLPRPRHHIHRRRDTDRRRRHGGGRRAGACADKTRLSFDLLRQAVEATARLSAFVVFILIGARVFSLTFFGVDGHRWVEHLLTDCRAARSVFSSSSISSFSSSRSFSISSKSHSSSFRCSGPVADKLGIDLIWFGVILGVNMQTSFLHPPFGFALFYLRSVAPRRPYLDRVTGREIAGVSTAQIYWGAVPFLFIQVLMIALVTLMPSMVMRYKQRPVSPSSGPTEFAPPGLPPPPAFDLPPPDLQLPPPPTLNLPPPTLDPGK